MRIRKVRVGIGGGGAIVPIVCPIRSKGHDKSGVGPGALWIPKQVSKIESTSGLEYLSWISCNSVSYVSLNPEKPGLALALIYLLFNYSNR